MSKFGVCFEGEMEDETFDTYDEALNYACYL